MSIRKRLSIPNRLAPKWTVAAGTVAAISLLSVYGGAAGASSISSHASRPLPSQAAASGTLNWEWALPTSWDPVTSSAGWDVHVLSLVYASITRLNPAGQAGPGLASSWKYAPGGKSVTFTIRPGLKFSDGTPLDANAVKESLERGLTQANSTEAAQLAVISGITVQSPTKLVINLNAVDYQLPNLLGGKDGMVVSPTAAAKSVTALATQPVGAGPFSLTSYVPNSHADLVRNPGYWDAADIHIQNFSVQDITDPQQILAALESGQVNVAYIAGNQVAAAKAAGLKIDDIPALPVVELDAQTTTPPFTNPKVVQAINYAINRQALVLAQQGGYGSISYQPFPKGYVGYNPKLADLYPYNPAKAKQLLAEAGFSKGLSVTLTSSSAADDVLAEQIQSQLKPVGINVTIKDIPADLSTQYMYIDKSLSFDIDGTAGRESPVAMLDVLYDQQGLMNVDGKTAKEPAAVAQALDKVLSVPLTSPDYPSTLQSAVATAVTDEPIHIWLYYTPRIFAISPKVTGIPFDLVQQRWEGVRVAS
jgi:peptide/nickel transport system substrate-binding protein